MVAGGCSGSATIETVGPSAVDEQPVLDAVIEPANAIVDDFGEDWSQADQWYTEGGITEWDSGCQAFDQLDAIFNHGLPTTTVWTSDTGDLVQRVASLDWEASSYVDLVRATPLDCPTITLGQTTVELRSVDATLLTAGDEATEVGSTQQASSHQYGAMELDAFPVADRETDTGNPELLPNRTTWMVVTARHNVVSQLIFAPTDGTGRDQLRSLVATMEAALDRAPIEAEGPIVKPPPPPTVEYQVIDREEPCGSVIVHEGAITGTIDPASRQLIGDGPASVDGTPAEVRCDCEITSNNQVRGELVIDSTSLFIVTFAKG